MEKTSVTVRVPATTANLGPAYDVMGMALDLWLEVTAEVADTFTVSIDGYGADSIPTTEENLVVQCAKIVFERCGVAVPPLRYSIVNGVPFGCGCGSSSAAAVAGLMVGLALSGKSLAVAGKEELLQIAAEVEGRPDNAAPAVYGGLQIGLRSGGRFHTHRLSSPAFSQIWCVLFVPAEKMKAHTSETRKLIPTTVSMADAIHNMSRSALLSLALSQGRLEQLRVCGDDRFHQNQRQCLFPHMQPVIEAAMAHGAVHAFLSGAGPTICAFVKGRVGETVLLPEAERLCDTVGDAMVRAAKDCGVAGRCHVTVPSELGAHVAAMEPTAASEVFATPMGL